MDPTMPVQKAAQSHGGTISWLSPDGERRSAVIDDEPVLVGRDSEAGLCIDDARVSRFHVELEASLSGVKVRDLGSVNGLWIGDVRINQAVLTARTTLRLGPVSVVFDPRPPSLADISPSTRCGPMFGSSVVMRQMFSRLERVAQTDVSVVVLGETGTGKEVFAHAIHSLSPRAAGPFVVVDCASIAPSLAEAALFGHERGAFTGATSARISPFVQASGGTLFLDELGELPLELQSKLLRALAEQKVQPLGASSYRPFDTRIVAATRRDLTRSVADASFRSDLYFRLAKLVVQLPPLRERTEDIPGLIRHFVELLAPGSSLRPSPETLTHLLTYDWPGNIRELRNAVEVAVALVEPDGILRIDEHLVTMRTAVTGAERTGGLAPYHDARKAALETFERAYFQRLAVAGAGNLSEMGRQAKLDRNHVRRYLVTHGLLPTKK